MCWPSGRRSPVDERAAPLPGQAAAEVPERFERLMSCTEADWQRWLPAALGAVTWQALGPSEIHARIGTGLLRLRWRVLPERPLSPLVRLPQLQVAFAFEHVGAACRRVFMQRFDLYLQRGGG